MDSAVVVCLCDESNRPTGRRRRVYARASNGLRRDSRRRRPGMAKRKKQNARKGVKERIITRGRHPLRDILPLRSHTKVTAGQAVSERVENDERTRTLTRRTHALV